MRKLRNNTGEESVEKPVRRRRRKRRTVRHSKQAREIAAAMKQAAAWVEGVKKLAILEKLVERAIATGLAVMR